MKVHRVYGGARVDQPHAHRISDLIAEPLRVGPGLAVHDDAPDDGGVLTSDGEGIVPATYHEHTVRWRRGIARLHDEGARELGVASGSLCQTGRGAGRAPVVKGSRSCSEESDFADLAWLDRDDFRGVRRTQRSCVQSVDDESLSVQAVPYERADLSALLHP